MNHLKTGTVYTASAHKSGDNSTGHWESLTVRDERGRNPITIFIDNTPSGIPENGQFRIDRITDVSFGRRLLGEDNYISVSSIRAVVTPVIQLQQSAPAITAVG